MIVDANVVISAVLGRSLPILSDLVDRGFDLFIPAEQHREVTLVSLREGHRQQRDVSALLALALDTVLLVDPSYYALNEVAARARLTDAERAQKDWPLLALAMATGDAIWTNDPDLFGTGVATWRTINIGFASPPSAEHSQAL